MAPSGESDTFASSTGQTFTGADWLDVHFEASRAEYEAQLRAVGIQTGWHVLDAGCGAGNFLPWLADLVGPSGRIAAFDLAPDNIAAVEARVAEWELATPVDARVGSLLALPYPDDTFDAVWCANTSQYLSDDELAATLAEMRRVVRPGGLVAVKESDPELTRILPAPPAVQWHHAVASARAGDVRMQSNVRVPTLPMWLRKAGLTEVRRRTTLIEHAAPMPAVSRELMRSFLIYSAGQAVGLDLPETDREFWASLRDPASVDRLLDDPDLNLCEGNMLAVGRVPEA